MGEAAPKYQQHEDFWRPLPSGKSASNVGAQPARERCHQCKTELAVAASFCHACGVKQANHQGESLSSRSRLEIRAVLHALDQNVASMIALVLGCVCMLAAVLTAFFFKVSTLSDWQAVQLWRIEWLLGAIAWFLVGILLKRRTPPQSQG
jgi:hypothetical protein